MAPRDRSSLLVPYLSTSGPRAPGRQGALTRRGSSSPEGLRQICKICMALSFVHVLACPSQPITRKSLLSACFDTTTIHNRPYSPIDRSMLREERIFTVFVGRFGAFLVKISGIF